MPMKRGTASEVPFPLLCRAEGVPAPTPEYKFALAAGGKRRWAFDWCWPDAHLALEVDGGGFVGGRHHRAAGFAEDCVKLNTALVLGWRVLRCTPQQVSDGSVFDFIKRALAARA